MRWLPIALFAAWQAQAPSIEGIAVRSTSNEPVANARILVAKVDGESIDSRAVQADDRGRFIIRGVSAGDYRLFATHDDFVKTASPIVRVVPGQAITPLTLRLTPTGVITGRVLDEFNEPVARAFVRATAMKSVYEGQTNDLGEYRLFGLPPGSYVVSAAPYAPPRIDPARQPFAYVVPTPPGPFARGEGQGMINLARLLELGDFIHPMALRGEAYARVYYPGTTDESSATPLDLAAGAVLTGIDLSTAIVPTR